MRALTPGECLDKGQQAWDIRVDFTWLMGRRDMLTQCFTLVKSGVVNAFSRQQSAFLCRPFKNVSTWRGFFEPSTATFLSERERV